MEKKNRGKVFRNLSLILTVFALILGIFLILRSLSFNKISAKVTPVKKSYSKVIALAMSSDENFIEPTMVAMTSALENKEDDVQLQFNLLLSGKVKDEDKERFKLLEKKYKDGCKVHLFNMKDMFSDGATGGHITTPAYYRLGLMSILPKCDKVLYIDGDIIVRRDLWELFNSDIEGFYVAGVNDLGIIGQNEKDVKACAKKLKIDNLDQYINSGVLLMNTKKMREDSVEKKFKEYVTLTKKNDFYMDQDIINSVCYNKIKLLSFKYNVPQHISLDVVPKNLRCYYSNSEWKNAVTDPVIVHWCGPRKPWRCKDVNFYSEWEKYKKIVDEIVENKS